MIKRALAAAVVSAASVSAHAQVLLSEGFESVASLSGWVLTNLSAPVGATGWYQGDSTVFTAQAGSAASYIAANYNNAAEGGTISNWLITPTFSTAKAGTVSFWGRADLFDGFADSIAYGLSPTGSSDTAAFALGSSVTLSGTWALYSLNYAAGGAGSTARFAIQYSGAADKSNYIGIDTLTVTAVPEPATWLLLGAGLLGVGAMTRRQRASVR